MTSPPRVLLVTTEITAQPRAGGALRTTRIAQALAAAFDLVVVVVGEPVDGRALSDLLGGAEVISHPTLRGWSNRPRAAMRRWPIPVARTAAPAALADIRRLQPRPAVTVLDHLRTWAFRPPTGRYLLSLHNAEAEWVAAMPAPGGSWRRLEQRWDVVATRRLQGQACADGRATLVTVSAADASTIGRPDAVVVPNGVDLPARVTPVPAQGPLLFVGALDYAPNVDALQWWCDEIWPLLPQPAVRLQVVGRGGAAAVRGLASHPGLDVVGEVADVTPWLQQARAAVQPLRIGSGTRLKVLEAMGHGRPVVATTTALAGFDLGPQQAAVADSPQAFAAAVTQVLTDDALAVRLADAGRRFAAGHDWSALLPRFVATVQAVADGAQ